MKTKTPITVMVALLALAMLVVGVSADCSPPIIIVDSPQNNHVYSSNDAIALNFSLQPNSGYIFTSYSYNIDGQPLQTTNSTSVISGLSTGSHTLRIYGNGSWHGAFGDERILLEIVYFSVGYSTAIVNFTVDLAAFLAFVFLALFVGRKRLIARLKQKKQLSFWFGLMILTFGAILFFPSAWWFLKLYIFPFNFHGLVAIPFIPMVYGAFILTFGLILTIFGTRKTKNH
jgi:hypothetical protein